MDERVFADLERALRAYRPDDADRLLREIEVWRALSGSWHTARFEPGGPLSVPVSPGPVMETVRAAAFAAFPDRAAAIVGSLARSLWPRGVRSGDGSLTVPYRLDESRVDAPDRFPTLVVLGPPDAARLQLRVVIEGGDLGWQPVTIPLTFRVASRVVAVRRYKRPLRVNGEEVEEPQLAEGDLLTGDYLPQLLFLDRAGA